MSEWQPIGILAIGGITAGAALVGGMVAGPLGALVGTAVGFGLGFYLQKNQLRR